MTHQYIGTKEVTAWPDNRNDDRGYAVKYSDGYISWSPADVFEAAYRVAEGPLQSLNYGDALYFLKKGRRVTRPSWNGAGLWVELQHPDAHSKMTQAYTYLCTSDGKRCPWVPSQSDHLAEDWRVLPQVAA